MLHQYSLIAGTGRKARAVVVFVNGNWSVSLPVSHQCKFCAEEVRARGAGKLCDELLLFACKDNSQKGKLVLRKWAFDIKKHLKVHLYRQCFSELIHIIRVFVSPSVCVSHSVLPMSWTVCLTPSTVTQPPYGGFPDIPGIM